MPVILDPGAAELILIDQLRKSRRANQRLALAAALGWSIVVTLLAVMAMGRWM